jgi:hypothetical protein
VRGSAAAALHFDTNSVVLHGCTSWQYSVLLYLDVTRYHMLSSKQVHL